MAMAELDAGAVITRWNLIGQRMAVGFVDGSIEVWSKGGAAALSRDFKWKAHEASVVKLCWGPSEFGDIVASSSTDGTIIVWEEIQEKSGIKWRQCSQLARNPNAVALDLQFGNCAGALKLITACADGHVRIYETFDSVELRNWQLQAVFPNVTDVSETIGKCVCTEASVSWKPSVGAVQQAIFVYGCCTSSTKFSAAKVWEFVEAHRRWYAIAELPNEKETAGVSSVSWAANLGRPYELIAVAAGNTVSVWKLDLSDQKGPSVRKAADLEHDAPVWQVEWDMSGMTLASSSADGVVRIWQAGLDGAWRHQASLEAEN